MKGIVIRNLKIFFKDKGAVFFSLLGVIIIVGLYVLFLGDTYSDSLKDFYKPENLMSGWIMAGLLAVTSVTTTMGAFGTMVQDKEKKIFKDFYCAPISRSALTLGYIVSSAIVGLIMTMLVLAATIIYLTATGVIVLSGLLIIKLLALSVLTSLSNTAWVFFVVTLFTSEKAFSALTGVMSALIGFVTGIYIPVGQFPDAVQYIVKCFPTSHSAVLFRQTLMDNALTESVKNMPSEAKDTALLKVKEILGVTFKFGDYECTKFVSIIILTATIVLFSFLAIAVLNKKKAK